MASKHRWVFRIVLDLSSLFLVFLPWIILNFGVEPYHRGFFCNDETLKHPYKDSTIHSAVLTSVSIMLPSIVILITEAVHVYVDKRNGLIYQPYPLGKWKIHPYFVTCYKMVGIFLFGLATQQTITNIGKFSVGRLRPHFFDVCQPNYTVFSCLDEQGHYRYVEEDVCTSTDEHRLKEMRLSFPSGHSSMSCYSATFTLLFLQARMTWKGSKLLRPFLQVIGMYMALFTSVSRINDYKHHWSDVLLGGLMGTAVAIIVGLYVTTLFKGPDIRYVVKSDQEAWSARARADSQESFTVDTGRDRRDYVPA